MYVVLLARLRYVLSLDSIGLCRFQAADFEPNRQSVTGINGDQ